MLIGIVRAKSVNSIVIRLFDIARKINIDKQMVKVSIMLY